MTGELIAITLGLLVGLSLGALGGGGSTLAVPILVFVAGMSAQDATTASLLVVGAASTFGVIGHFRAGNVRLGAGIAFGAAGIVGSRIGTLLNQSIDEQVLLLAFSALIVFVAIRMYRSVSRKSELGTIASVLDVDGDAGSRGAEPPSGALVTKARAASQVGFDLSVTAVVKLAAAATAVGLLTGLFGVGGGFAVVPALALLTWVLVHPERTPAGLSSRSRSRGKRFSIASISTSLTGLSRRNPPSRMLSRAVSSGNT